MSCNGRGFPIRDNFTQIEADKGENIPVESFTVVEHFRADEFVLYCTVQGCWTFYIGRRI